MPFTKALHDAGEKLLAGTDSFFPTLVPGFSLHDELKEFVDVGLTPYEALKTSTTHPFEYLGELENAGTIEKKIANLVLLEKNPLEDISSDTNYGLGTFARIICCRGLLLSCTS